MQLHVTPEHPACRTLEVGNITELIDATPETIIIRFIGKNCL